MPQDKIKVKGHVKCVLKDENGNVKEVQEFDNLVTELFDALVADRFAGGSDTLITHGHAGTGSGQTAADTNLDAHFDEARTAIDSITQGAGAADNDVVVVFTLGAGVCTGQIEEVGLFSNSAQATEDMKAYSDTISFLKGALDTLIITWCFSFGAS
jgi:hypothetical protein